MRNPSDLEGEITPQTSLVGEFQSDKMSMAALLTAFWQEPLHILRFLGMSFI
jgi:hypothetical protein